MNVVILKKLAISYHFALKKTLGLPKWASNHYLFDTALSKFRSLFKIEDTKFYLWMKNCTSPCVALHKVYFLSYLVFIQSFINCFR